MNGPHREPAAPAAAPPRPQPGALRVLHLTDFPLSVAPLRLVQVLRVQVERVGSTAALPLAQLQAQLERAHPADRLPSAVPHEERPQLDRV